MHKIVLAAPLMLALAACATTAPEAPIERDFTLTPQGELTPRSQLYADCIAQAARSNTYGRAHDDSTEMVRFNCSGPPARAFYEALEDWSLEQDSRWEREGWSYRSTDRIVRNLFGADWCSSDGSAYVCVIHLNVGAFARPRED